MNARSRAGAPPRRILVRGPNWLGDVVMATPALRRLRAAYPSAKIVVQVPGPLMPLLAGNAACDEVWPVASRGGGLGGWREDWRRLRSEKFDLGIAIPESVSSALLMRIGGVARVVGFARDTARRALLHAEVPAPAAWGKRRLVSRERFALYLVESVIRLERQRSEPPAGPPGSPAASSSPPDFREGPGTDAPSEEALRLELQVSDAEEAALDKALRDRGASLAEPSSLTPSDPLVVLAPGASFGTSKCWPAESYAALGDRLAAGGARVVVVGGPGESARVAAVTRAMTHEAVALDDCLDLGALKTLLSRAALLVANDAGARHIAAAFRRPSVIFFGPTSVAKTADHLEAIEVLETEQSCRPCYKRECPIDHRCLREISVDDAALAAGRALAREGVLPGVRF